MTAQHSIWLLAAPPDQRLLAGAVKALAERFGLPRFHPHLTLAGDLAAGSRHLTDALEALVAGTAPIVQPVVEIGTTDAFFRSFYARFEATEPLADLRRRAYEAARAEEPHPFLPHVSLAYGPIEPAAKAAARAEWETWLAGTTVRFDRVAVVRAAENVPLDEWATLAERKLATE